MSQLLDPPAASPPPVRRWTADELALLPNEKEYELVDGRLVERDMSLESSWVAGQILRRLGAATEESAAGIVFPADAAFRCFPQDPDQVRRPDASFVRTDRISKLTLSRGYGRIAPDLVVEVVSPNDLAYDVERKVDDWLAAGVVEVWVVHPASRTVEVRTTLASQRFFETEEISTPIIPSFRCPVSDFFLAVPSAGQAPST